MPYGVLYCMHVGVQELGSETTGVRQVLKSLSESHPGCRKKEEKRNITALPHTSSATHAFRCAASTDVPYGYLSCYWRVCTFFVKE